MRVAACLLVATLLALLSAALGAIVLDLELPLFTRVSFGIIAAVTCAAAALVAARPFLQLPAAAATPFRGFCIALPALYFIGSMDNGVFSGPEIALGGLVAGFSWAAWRIFDGAKAPVHCVSTPPHQGKSVG